MRGFFDHREESGKMRNASRVGVGKFHPAARVVSGWACHGTDDRFL